MLANELEPLVLFVGEALPGSNLFQRAFHPLLCGEDWLFRLGCVLDHGDDVGQGFVMHHFVSLLQICFSESGGRQLLPKFVELVSAPLFRLVQKNLDRVDLVSFRLDESGKAAEIVFGPEEVFAYPELHR